ncbi:MAG: hypothetical protein KBD26_02845 [Candidatus Pacebacteria bacterium]|nr:hypothetical protein [Candidatus Paceibacterota bacterium]MBP9772748.1 hypothetical protein [Candidatus Paceibacterota bacterium]
MSERRDIGIIVCGHIGTGTTTTALIEMMHREVGVEMIIIDNTQEVSKKEFEFRNKIPIEIIQAPELPVFFFDREPRFYGKQTKFRNSYLNHKKKYKTLRRNDRVIK